MRMIWNLYSFVTRDGTMISKVITSLLLLCINNGVHAYTSLVDSDVLKEFTIANTQFAIPERYFWGTSIYAKGNVRSINMLVLYPDLKPYSLKNSDQIKNCRGRCEKIYINIRESSSTGQFSKIAKGIDMLFKGKDIDSLQKKIASKYYYELFLNKKKTSKWGVYPIGFYYCTSQKEMQPTCYVNADLNSNITIQMSFSKKYSEEVFSILIRTIELVKSKIIHSLTKTK